MSSQFEVVNEAVKQAMKSQDSDRLLTLRSLVSEIKNVALKQARKDITDDDVLVALTKGVKQREDSIAMYVDANRVDLVEKETRQLNILKEFLPTQLSESEVIEIVQAAVYRQRAPKSIKLMGVVMKELNPSLKGKTDMKKVNAILSDLLSA